MIICKRHDRIYPLRSLNEHYPWGYQDSKLLTSLIWWWLRNNKTLWLWTLITMQLWRKGSDSRTLRDVLIHGTRNYRLNDHNYKSCRYMGLWDLSLQISSSIFPYKLFLIQIHWWPVAILPVRLEVLPSRFKGLNLKVRNDEPWGSSDNYSNYGASLD